MAEANTHRLVRSQGPASRSSPSLRSHLSPGAKSPRSPRSPGRSPRGPPARSPLAPASPRSPRGMRRSRSDFLAGSKSPRDQRTGRRRASLDGRGGVGSTAALMGGMKDGESNVMVAVRVRPLLPKERSKRSIVKVMDGNMVVLMDPDEDKEDFLRRNRTREMRYAFDHVFDDRPSREIFETTTSFLLSGVLNGYNATVFAYGATGAGKTHTMLGNDNEPGVMFLTLQELFTTITNKQTDSVFECCMAYMEVYNENIRDLLRPSQDYLDLREDPIKGVQVIGVHEIKVTDAQQVMDLLLNGNKYRTTEPTAMNQVSSRSHAVLQVTVKRRERTSDTSHDWRIGKLSMIDLAGSERASVSQNSGQRLLEGANINRSLLALGNCINALGDKSNRGTYVNYRDSKLTRLLKDSLGGNCRTVMIANISPAWTQFEETHNTLKYANRAKNIKTKVSRNVLNVSYHIAQYTSIISDLRAEVLSLKEQLQLQPEDSDGSGGGDGEAAAGSDVSKLEKDEMRKLRTEIVNNFQETMQLRRSLIDLEDLTLHNSIEINRRQAEIQQWEKRHPDADKPQNIEDMESDMLTLIANNKKNKKLRRNLIRRLKANKSRHDALSADLPKRITNEEHREFLALEYRIKGLELENMELEESNLLHDSVVRQKDLLIRKLQLQLELRDSIIQEQSALLQKHGIDDVSLRQSFQHVEDHISIDAAAAATATPRTSIGDTIASPRLLQRVRSMATMEEVLPGSPGSMASPRSSSDTAASGPVPRPTQIRVPESPMIVRDVETDDEARTPRHDTQQQQQQHAQASQATYGPRALATAASAASMATSGDADGLQLPSARTVLSDCDLSDVERDDETDGSDDDADDFTEILSNLADKRAKRNQLRAAKERLLILGSVIQSEKALGIPRSASVSALSRMKKDARQRDGSNSGGSGSGGGGAPPRSKSTTPEPGHAASAALPASATGSTAPASNAAKPARGSGVKIGAAKRVAAGRGGVTHSKSTSVLPRRRSSNMLPSQIPRPAAGTRTRGGQHTGSSAAAKPRTSVTSASEVTAVVKPRTPTSPVKAAPQSPRQHQPLRSPPGKRPGPSSPASRGSATTAASANGIGSPHAAMAATAASRRANRSGRVHSGPVTSRNNRGGGGIGNSGSARKQHQSSLETLPSLTLVGLTSTTGSDLVRAPPGSNAGKAKRKKRNPRTASRHHGAGSTSPNTGEGPDFPPVSPRRVASTQNAGTGSTSSLSIVGSRGGPTPEPERRKRKQDNMDAYLSRARAAYGIAEAPRKRR